MYNCYSEMIIQHSRKDINNVTENETGQYTKKVVGTVQSIS